MNSTILSIGDEVLLGQISDTNSPWLSQRLTELGCGVIRRETVGDDPAAITQALTRCAADSDLILATGGLGPTEDDQTRFALAEALGTTLSTDPVALDQIRSFFARRNRPMHERNAVQALIPNGAKALENPLGTAPGICARLNQCEVIVLPGVPAEMRALFQQHVEPSLQTRKTCHILTESVHLFGLAESRLADQLGAALLDRHREPLVGNTVRDGVITLRIRSTSPDLKQAETTLKATLEQIEKKLGPLAFGRGSATLEESVGRLLLKNNHTLATAESCTGGLLGHLLTGIPGSSRYYLGGWITYANALKQNQLGVDPAILARAGAVSELTATLMAEGARTAAGSDFALSITGIAGPDGGSPDKPVGTVWIGLAQRGKPTLAFSQIFPDNREEVRRRSALTALNHLRLHLLKSP